MGYIQDLKDMRNVDNVDKITEIYVVLETIKKHGEDALKEKDSYRQGAMCAGIVEFLMKHL